MSLRPVFADLEVGQELPADTFVVTRETLIRYAGASGDFNVIHWSQRHALEVGLPDVIAHGMLSMGWLARLLTNWVPQTAIRDYSVRFAAMTQVHEKITCTGQVTEKFEVDGERRVRLSLTTANADGQVKLAGDAVVALA